MLEHEEFGFERFSKKYGKDKGYTGDSCPRCGRVRLIHFSRGFTICEKCKWCIEENDYCTDWTD